MSHPPQPPILGSKLQPNRPGPGGPPKPGPHARRRLGRAPALILSVFIGTLLALIVAFLMNYFSVAWAIILPSLAPIWVGSITLVYTEFKDK